ncbi:hypothetical protein ACQP00_45430 [Dactylosporangium sp. CS-047395]|uniref:hypothetical protein n=1 Tax=Dactylosporangium sp. CS-047395 TaxID=3239936 RepID=UPI003D8AF678
MTEDRTPVWKREAGWTEPERRLTGIVLPSFEDPEGEPLDEFERDRRARTAEALPAASLGPSVPVVPSGPPPAWPPPEPSATEPVVSASATTEAALGEAAFGEAALGEAAFGEAAAVAPPVAEPASVQPRREFPRFIRGEFVLPVEEPTGQPETATLAPPALFEGFDPLTAPVDVLEARLHPAAVAAPEGLRNALPSWAMPPSPPAPPPVSGWERTPVVDLPRDPRAVAPGPPATFGSTPEYATPEYAAPEYAAAEPVTAPPASVSEPTWQPVLEAPTAQNPIVQAPSPAFQTTPSAAQTTPAAFQTAPTATPTASAAFQAASGGVGERAGGGRMQVVQEQQLDAVEEDVAVVPEAPRKGGREGAPHPAFPDATARTFRILPIAADLMPLEITGTRHVRRVRRGVISGVALVVALVVGWYGYSVHEHSRAEDDRQAILDTSQDLTRQKHKQYDELTRIQAESGQIDQRLEQMLEYDLSWSKMLASLRDTAAAKNVKLSGITAALSQEALIGKAEGDVIGNVTLTGKAPSKDAVAAYVDALVGVAGVANPFPSDATQEADGVSFTIRVDITRAALGGRFTSAAPSASPSGSK